MLARITRSFALAPLLTGLVLGSGCSSSSDDSNKPPVIDALDMPATATGTSNGDYQVTGSITFHDDDGTVDSVHVKFSQGGFEQTIDTASGSAPHPKQAQAKLTVTAQGAPLGTKLDYDVWVVDSSGAESAHQARSTVLQ